MSNMVVFGIGGSLCPSICDFHDIHMHSLMHMRYPHVSSTCVMSNMVVTPHVLGKG